MKDLFKLRFYRGGEKSPLKDGTGTHQRPDKKEKTFNPGFMKKSSVIYPNKGPK